MTCFIPDRMPARYKNGGEHRSAEIGVWDAGISRVGP